MVQNFVKRIRQHVELDEDDVQILLKYVRPVNRKKKEYLVEAGQICRALYFVEKGCLRMFFINDKSAEQITQFAIDGWWISDYFSFMDGKPSEYFIQAIEKSEILSIDVLSFDELLKELPQMERYFRIIMQKALAASQLRNKLIYEMTKEEFFQYFSTSFPEFVQRVPQYMVASYLGLTPEYVSELRKKKH
jgi:CRP-like cAMP-binding protein